MVRHKDTDDCTHSSVPRVTVKGLLHEVGRGEYPHTTGRLVVVEKRRSYRPTIGTRRPLVSIPGSESGGVNLGC